ncbi:MAG: hypothetical protein KKC03_05275 [Bacteroidetes bacterium]|nr:hypothetical protein [Bacteroidota bacterium]
MMIFLLSLWFTTCKHWWYHAIIVPLGMYIFQFINLFLLDFKEQDEMDIYFTVPLVGVVLFLLYYLKRNIKSNVEIINLDDDIDKELEKIDRLDELKAKEKEKRARAGSRDINDLL